MIILGIDPGTTRIGWAVLKATKSNVKPIDYGCWETTKTTQGQRLLKISKNLNQAIKKHQPSIVAIEKVF